MSYMSSSLTVRCVVKRQVVKTTPLLITNVARCLAAASLSPQVPPSAAGGALLVLCAQRAQPPSTVSATCFTCNIVSAGDWG